MARHAHRTIRAKGVASEPPPHATALPVATRVFSTFEPRKAKWQKKAKPEGRRRPVPPRPSQWLVFDCETRTDETQRLTFGSYRFLEDGEQLEEGLFIADDLSLNERRTIAQYASRAGLPVLSLPEFRKKFYWLAYKARALVIGFNLPFDFSRIADGVSEGRLDFYGGFSFWMDSQVDERHRRRPNDYRPKVRVKHIDSMRALLGLSGRFRPDPEDQIPDESIDGKPVKGYRFPGYFLDLRTLAFALSDRRHTLESACKAFGVAHGKQKVRQHGVITGEYIDYNRRDVLATAELAVKLLEEFDRHPVQLRAMHAFSPASIGKAYLAEMGIPPVLERQPDFPKRFLGHAQSAFVGGRTSAHIRRVPMPVVYTDFLSMYPTVNALMNLWQILTARTIKVQEGCSGSVRRFLARVAAEPDCLFEPSTWPLLNAFVRVVPRGDVLPCRAVYSDASNDWQVGINHIYARGEDTQTGIWYALPDVVASVVLTGKVPELVDAFRLVGVGRLATLRPLMFRGAVAVDPATEDFFRTVIERRQEYKQAAKRPDESGKEADRIQAGLKVLANSTAYGINAEFIREDTEAETRVECHGIDATGFADSVTHPERPGEYCFPPLAALITSGARLMLALLEQEVERRGGTYVMEDTDSMAIVAMERGGLVACPGGSHKLPNGRDAVNALTWNEVQDIRDRFKSLNPYDPTMISGSVLKIEGENFGDDGRQRQLYCLAISAKRYALFTLDADGEPHLLRGNKKSDNRWSEHGLGHLMNPLDPSDEKRDWIGQVWERLIRRSLGLRAKPSPFATTPAVGRVTVSSTAVLRAFSDFNEDRSYAAQIKPFNFLLACHVAPFGHPVGTIAKRFHLIAPYEKDSRKWLRAKWLDQYSGKRYGVRTGESASASMRGVAHVQSYADVVDAYEFHPEAKCAAPDGAPSGKQTKGLHRRRHIIIDSVTYIGKESNELEDVEAGMVSPDQVYTQFNDKRRDFWSTKVVSAMKRVSLRQLIAATGLTRQTIVDARTGRRRPHRRNRSVLIAALARLGALAAPIH